MTKPSVHGGKDVKGRRCGKGRECGQTWHLSAPPRMGRKQTFSARRRSRRGKRESSEKTDGGLVWQFNVRKTRGEEE